MGLLLILASLYRRLPTCPTSAKDSKSLLCGKPQRGGGTLSPRGPTFCPCFPSRPAPVRADRSPRKRRKRQMSRVQCLPSLRPPPLPHPPSHFGSEPFLCRFYDRRPGSRRLGLVPSVSLMTGRCCRSRVSRSSGRGGRGRGAQKGSGSARRRLLIGEETAPLDQVLAPAFPGVGRGEGQGSGRKVGPGSLLAAVVLDEARTRCWMSWRRCRRGSSISTPSGGNRDPPSPPHPPSGPGGWRRPAGRRPGWGGPHPTISRS
jgi:hypothetical protein